MKISYIHWRGNTEISSISQAVSEACIPDPYSYEGELERIKAQNEKLREIVGRLCEVLFNDDRFPTNEPAKALQHVLGYEYEVEA